MAHSQLIYLLQMVMFHSYVSLPEGTFEKYIESYPAAQFIFDFSQPETSKSDPKLTYQNKSYAIVN